MATLVLSVAGGIVGGTSSGRLARSRAGCRRIAGSAIDPVLFGGHDDRSGEGPRLADLK